MRPAGPQGRIRRRLRIRDTAGRAGAPGPIARTSRRIDMCILFIAATGSRRIVNGPLHQGGLDGRVLSEIGVAAQGFGLDEYVRNDDLLPSRNVPTRLGIETARASE